MPPLPVGQAGPPRQPIPTLPTGEAGKEELRFLLPRNMLGRPPTARGAPRPQLPRPPAPGARGRASPMAPSPRSSGSTIVQGIGTASALPTPVRAAANMAGAASTPTAGPRAQRGLTPPVPLALTAGTETTTLPSEIQPKPQFPSQILPLRLLLQLRPDLPPRPSRLTSGSLGHLARRTCPLPDRRRRPSPARSRRAPRRAAAAPEAGGWMRSRRAPPPPAARQLDPPTAARA